MIIIIIIIIIISKNIINNNNNLRIIILTIITTNRYSQRSTITAREPVNWWVTPVERLPNCQGNSTRQNYWFKKLYTFNI
jgi:hypothetical protein